MNVNTKHVLMSGQTTLLLMTLQVWADNIQLLWVLREGGYKMNSEQEIVALAIRPPIADSHLHKQTGLFELTNWAGVNSPRTFLCAFDPWSRSFRRLWKRWASWVECARTQHVLVHVQTNACVSLYVSVCVCEGALDRITKECGLVNSQSAQKAVQSPYIYI